MKAEGSTKQSIENSNEGDEEAELIARQLQLRIPPQMALPNWEVNQPAIPENPMRVIGTFPGEDRYIIAPTTATARNETQRATLQIDDTGHITMPGGFENASTPEPQRVSTKANKGQLTSTPFIKRNIPNSQKHCQPKAGARGSRLRIHG